MLPVLVENFCERNDILPALLLAEPLSCLLSLKSTSEDNQVEIDSAVRLQPGSSDYHDL